MELNESIDQLATRRYVVRRGSHEEFFDIGISAPYCPAKTQEFPGFCACMIYSNLSTREDREILGRDPMEALCHALLAIEARLLMFIRSDELFNEDGTKAEASDVGMFFGTIGSKYRHEFRDFSLDDKAQDQPGEKGPAGAPFPGPFS